MSPSCTCGQIGPNAVASRDGIAIWMGETGVSSYGGSVTKVVCDVHSEVYGNINKFSAF